MEFVLVLPIVLMLTIGTIYLSMMMYAASCLHYAVEDAARCVSVKTATCTNVSTTQAYALTRYSGPRLTPALTAASFAVTLATAGSCGNKVEITGVTYQLRTGIRTLSVPLSAKACFPDLN